MLRALSGVLAKKALVSALSKKGIAKLASKEAPERQLKQDSFYAHSHQKYTKSKNAKDLKTLDLLLKEHK